MDINVWTTRNHEIILRAATGEQVVMTGDEDILISEVTIQLTTDVDGNLKPLQTQFVAKGLRLGADRVPTRQKRIARGHNLNRLPVEVVDKILVFADHVGVKGLREDLGTTYRR
jgi:hypothetical protein